MESFIKNTKCSKKRSHKKTAYSPIAFSSEIPECYFINQNSSETINVQRNPLDKYRKEENKMLICEVISLL